MKFVKIDNVQNEETIPHQLLLLHGSVDSAVADKFCITCNGETVDHLIRDFNFRALLQLKLGKNSIQFLPMREFFEVYYVPSTCERFVRVILVTLRDDIKNDHERKLASEKISLAAKLLQCFIAEEIKAKFGHRKTFRFEKDDHVSVSDLLVSEFCEDDLRHFNNEKLYWKFAKEILEKYNDQGRAKYLAVLYCTKFCDSNSSSNKPLNWEDVLARTKFYVNYSVGDVAIAHGGGLYAWPIKCNEILIQFMNRTPVGRYDLNDSAGRDTIGGVYATTLGTALHELGHVFDLVHTTTGVMARGFDNIQLALIGDCYEETVAIQNESRSNTRIFHCNQQEDNQGVLQEEINYHFSEHCLLLLNYHKWMNSTNSGYADETTALQLAVFQILSENGLILVELRTKNGDRCTCWDLSLYKPKRWILPEELSTRNEKFDLFVIDSKGVSKLFGLN